jgi:hypothetical protein
MNYHYSDWVYRKYNLEVAMSDDFFYQAGKELAPAFEKQGVNCQVVF